MAAQRGISQAGTTSNEAEELKVQLRDALLDANESGKMAEVLDASLGWDDGMMGVLLLGYMELTFFWCLFDVGECQVRILCSLNHGDTSLTLWCFFTCYCYILCVVCF